MTRLLRARRTTVSVAGWLALTAVVLHGAEPELIVTPIARDGQVFVSFDLAQGLTPDVRDAIQSGLPTAFTYDIELRRSAAWFDETIAKVTLGTSVRFDNLSRRYTLSRSVDGRPQPPNTTEDEQAMRRWMFHVDRLPIASTSALETNGEYYVRIRVNARPRTRWFAWPWDAQAARGQAAFTFIP